jgi:hypothetical protein
METSQDTTQDTAPHAMQDADVGVSVGEAAARLGVAPSTLRTWQRRYGIAPTARSAGGHRRYLACDVAVLDHMHQLLLEGYSPSRAAAAALHRLSAVADQSGDGVGPGTPDPARGDGEAGSASMPAPRYATGWAPSAASGDRHDAAAGATAAGQRGGGGPGGQVLSVPGASPQARGLARAAVQLDGDACVRIIEAALGEHHVERAWDLVLRPVLVAAGAHWARTGQGVEIEHLLTESTIEALRSYRRSCPSPDERPPALLACAPVDQHSLPLHVLAAALAERRQAAQVLGPRVPAAALSAAVRRTRSRRVFLWAQLPDVRNGAALTELPVLRPRPVVVVGGPGWTGLVPDGARPVASLGAAARILSAPYAS